MIQQAVSLKHALAAVMTCALVACGGSGGTTTPPTLSGSPGSTGVTDLTTSASTTEVINGVTVPKVDAVAAKATVKGIDANGNGVRDEIERSLAGIYGATPGTFTAAMKYAAKMQTQFDMGSANQSQAQAAVLSELQNFHCLTSAVGDAAAREIADEVDLRTFNTQARRLERNRLLQAGGMFELPSSSAASC